MSQEKTETLQKIINILNETHFENTKWDPKKILSLDSNEKYELAATLKTKIHLKYKPICDFFGFKPYQIANYIAKRQKDKPYLTVQEEKDLVSFIINKKALVDQKAISDYVMKIYSSKETFNPKNDRPVPNKIWVVKFLQKYERELKKLTKLSPPSKKSQPITLNLNDDIVYDQEEEEEEEEDSISEEKETSYSEEEELEEIIEENLEDVWINNTREIIKLYGIKPSNIINISEKKVELNNINSSSPLLFNKSDYADSINNINSLFKKQKKSISLNVCGAISANGQSFPIYSVLQIPSNIQCDVIPNPSFGEMKINNSDFVNEHVTTDAVMWFFDNYFDKNEKKLLLIDNNGGTNYPVKLVNYARENNIIIKGFPFNLGSKLQPLDLVTWPNFEKQIRNEYKLKLKKDESFTLNQCHYQILLYNCWVNASNPISNLNAWSQSKISVADVFDNEDHELQSKLTLPNSTLYTTITTTTTTNTQSSPYKTPIKTLQKPQPSPSPTPSPQSILKKRKTMETMYVDDTIQDPLQKLKKRKLKTSGSPQTSTYSARLYTFFDTLRNFCT